MKQTFTSLCRTILLACLVLAAQHAAATIYTFNGTGDWTSEAKWSPSYPGTTIGPGHGMIIAGTCTISTSVSSSSTINVSEGGTLINNGSFVMPSAYFLNNGGTFIHNGSTPFTSYDFTNYGSVTINSGKTLEVGFAFRQFSPTCNLYGTIIAGGSIATIGSGSVLTVHNGGSITFNAAYSPIFGTLNNNGTVNVGSGGNIIIQPNSTLNNNSILNNNGSVGGIGTLVQNGTFTQSSTAKVDPGFTIGQFFVTGNLSLDHGALRCEIDGTTQITDYDLLSVTGTATITATSKLALVFSSVPPVGTNYDIATAGTVSGTFTPANISTSGGSVLVEVTYPNNNKIRVTVVAPPVVDSDGDGTPDPSDGCPNDPNKIAPGACGCNVADTDSDGDGTPNCNDGCPNNPNKIAPGTCGCDVADTDSDGDGYPNCVDGCPNNPNMRAPGPCGCNTTTPDSDHDGVADCNDGCPYDKFKTAPGGCGCGVPDTDSDADGTPDCLDGCPNDPNKIAPGVCKCGVAETDSDGDGVPNCFDNCTNAYNPNQADSDCDIVGNICDVCPGGNDLVDNNNDGLPDCKYPPAFSQIIAAWKCGTSSVYVAHRSGSTYTTTCVSYSTLSTHLAHGDYLGPRASCNGQNLVSAGNPSTDVTTTVAYTDLSLFPNPAGDEVNIYLEREGSQATLTIYDQLGKTVWTENLEAGQISTTLHLDDSRFGNGIYLVCAVSNGEKFTQRLVVVK